MSNHCVAGVPGLLQEVTCILTNWFEQAEPWRAEVDDDRTTSDLSPREARRCTTSDCRMAPLLQMASAAARSQPPAKTAKRRNNTRSGSSNSRSLHCKVADSV